jgi:predicted kinase
VESVTADTSLRHEPFINVTREVSLELDRLSSETKPTFFFLTGINGSGKTTFKLKFLNDMPFISYDTIVHPLLKDREDPDEYIKDVNLEIVEQMEQKMRDLLDHSESSLIFEEASIGLSLYRAHFIYLARLNGYKVVLLYFPLDKRTAHARNRQRSLGMSKEGQIRLPDIIVETLDEHKNTNFRIKSPQADVEIDTSLSQDFSKVPSLVNRMSEHEKLIINEAFFRFPTLLPEDPTLRRHLETHDVFDEIWELTNAGLFIRGC